MTEARKESESPREYPDKPLVGVGAVVIEKGKILLVKRAFEPGAGKWSVPGGLVEVGEKLSEACAREAEEETGLRVQVLELINVFDMIDRDESGKVRYHYVLADFLVKPVTGELRPNAEVTEMKWYTREETKNLEMTRTARRALDELFGGSLA